MAEVFVDTNVLIYGLSDDETKQRQANAVLFGEGEWMVSSQVLIEYASVCLKKKLLPARLLRRSISELTLSAARVLLVDETTIGAALGIHERTGYSWWGAPFSTPRTCRTANSSTVRASSARSATELERSVRARREPRRGQAVRDAYQPPPTVSDPRNVAHDKKVMEEKKHHGEDPAEGAAETPQPGKKPAQIHDEPAEVDETEE